MDKPLERGVMLKPDKNSKPEWFEIQFEKLPFYCFSCGIMGHTELDCPTPAPRNALGKLPYDLRLRAPKERRRKFQSFGQAAEESFGSASSRRTSSSRNSAEKRPPHRPREAEAGEDEEVNSPVKNKGEREKEGRDDGGRVPKSLFKDRAQRKRKPGAGTPGLNLPAIEAGEVPNGLVHDRIDQLGSTFSHAEDASEVQKKQKTYTTQRARSAAVADSDPRWAQ